MRKRCFFSNVSSLTTSVSLFLTFCLCLVCSCVFVITYVYFYSLSINISLHHLDKCDNFHQLDSSFFFSLLSLFPHICYLLITRLPLVSISFQRQCTLKIEQSGCSSGMIPVIAISSCIILLQIYLYSALP